MGNPPGNPWDISLGLANFDVFFPFLLEFRKEVQWQVLDDEFDQLSGVIL